MSSVDDESCSGGVAERWEPKKNKKESSSYRAEFVWTVNGLTGGSEEHKRAFVEERQRKADETRGSRPFCAGTRLFPFFLSFTTGSRPERLPR